MAPGGSLFQEFASSGKISDATWKFALDNGFETAAAKEEKRQRYDVHASPSFPSHFLLGWV